MVESARRSCWRLFQNLGKGCTNAEALIEYSTSNREPGCDSETSLSSIKGSLLLLLWCQMKMKIARKALSNEVWSLHVLPSLTPLHKLTLSVSPHEQTVRTKRPAQMSWKATPTSLDLKGPHANIDMKCSSLDACMESSQATHS